MNKKTLTFKNAEGRLFSVQLTLSTGNFMHSMVDFFDISDSQSTPYPIGISCDVDLLLATEFEKDSPASILHHDSLPMWGIIGTALDEIKTWLETHQPAIVPVDFSQTLNQAQQQITTLETQLHSVKAQLSPKQQQKMIVHLLSAKKHLLKAELLLF